MTRNEARWRYWAVIPLVLFGTAAMAAETGVRRVKEKPAATGEAAEKPSCWIGVMLGSPEAALKEQLKLKAGAMVQQVVPDSPAAKAGLKENDVILKFNDVKIDDPQNLAEAVQQNGDKEAKLTVFRDGQEQVIAVQPGPRPEGVEPWGAGPWEPRIREMLKMLEQGDAEGPLKFRLMQPGLVLPEEFQGQLQYFTDGVQMRPKWLADLPKNVSVTITKPEEGPVKIVVQKDGKTWEATEDKLDGLPEDIRSVVQGMFSGGMSIVVGGGRTPEFRWRELREAPRGKEKPRSEPAPEAQGEAKRPQQPAAPPADALQQRLDQIHRQMREQQENLQRELEKLRREMEKMRQEKPKPEKI